MCVVVFPFILLCVYLSHKQLNPCNWCDSRELFHQPQEFLCICPGFLYNKICCPLCPHVFYMCIRLWGLVRHLVFQDHQASWGYQCKAVTDWSFLLHDNGIFHFMFQAFTGHNNKEGCFTSYCTAAEPGSRLNSVQLSCFTVVNRNRTERHQAREGALTTLLAFVMSFLNQLSLFVMKQEFWCYWCCWQYTRWISSFICRKMLLCSFWVLLEYYFS